MNRSGENLTHLPRSSRTTARRIFSVVKKTLFPEFEPEDQSNDNVFNLNPVAAQNGDIPESDQVDNVVYLYPVESKNGDSPEFDELRQDRKDFLKMIGLVGLDEV